MLNVFLPNVFYLIYYPNVRNDKGQHIAPFTVLGSRSDAQVLGGDLIDACLLSLDIVRITLEHQRGHAHLLHIESFDFG